MPIDPGQLRIITYPHTALRDKARPVERVTGEVRAVALRMIELMHIAEGIGLAANQVGIPWRVFVAHVPPSDDPKDHRSLEADPPSATDGAVVYINPVLTEPERDLVPHEEGCLSLPDIRGEVRRPSIITITATDIEGKQFTRRASGLLARCWQHECDHLDGVLIIDRMSHLSRMKNKHAIRDLEDDAADAGMML